MITMENKDLDETYSKIKKKHPKVDLKLIHAVFTFVKDNTRKDHPKGVSTRTICNSFLEVKQSKIKTSLKYLCEYRKKLKFPGIIFGVICFGFNFLF